MESEKTAYLNNVVFVVGQLGNGGLERQLGYLIEELLAKGVNATCVVWNISEEDYYVPYFRELLGSGLVGFSKKIGSRQKLGGLRKVIKETDANLVISFSAFTNIPVYMATIGTGIPSVGSLRTSAKFYMSSGGIKAKLNLLFPHRLLANSKNALNELDDSLLHKVILKKALYPNVLDLARFNFSRQSTAGFTSISVGNVRPAKRLDRMLEMFEVVRANGLSFQHIHVGGGEGLEAIKTLCASKNLSDSISFLGPRSDVFQLLKNSDLFVHFSEYEGSPNVIMEAMASGLPVITTDCGDAKEYVSNGETGFVVAPFMAAEFAEKYERIASDKHLYERMTQKALEEIQASSKHRLPEIFLKSLNDLGLNFIYSKKK